MVDFHFESDFCFKDVFEDDDNYIILQAKNVAVSVILQWINLLDIYMINIYLNFFFVHPH